MLDFIHDTTGATNLYAVIARNDSARWRFGSTNAYEAFTVASWGEYAYALTESPAGSYRYPVVIPAGINTSTLLTVFVYERVGASPAVSDTLLATSEVRWTGASTWGIAQGTANQTIRDAMGLPSGGLEGILADLPTVAEFNARTLPAASYFDPAVDPVIVGDKTGFSLSQAFPANFASLAINASGHVSRVVLVDTTTTNTDMFDTAGVETTITNAVDAALLGVATDIATEAVPLIVSGSVADIVSGATPGIISGATSGIVSGSVAGILDGVDAGFISEVVDGVLAGEAFTLSDSIIGIIAGFIPQIGDNGEFLLPFTVKTASGTVIPACEVVLTTTDNSSTNDVYANGMTNSAGRIEFRVAGDATYYIWRNKSRFQFSDPIQVDVSDTGVVTFP